MKAFWVGMFAALLIASPIDVGISLIIGLLSLWLAWRSIRAPDDAEQQQPEGLTPVKAFRIDSFINLTGPPFALPYKVDAFLMPVTLGLIGMALVADALSCVMYGEGLS